MERACLTELVNPVINSEQLLRWWHRHQARWLTAEADAIRNGLLQDLFAVRRRLELTIGEDDNSLAMVERLYGALESLGNRLSSPYLQESLPLALQHALSDWPPQIPLSAELPARWSPEPMENITLLLSVVEHLRQTLAVLPSVPQACALSLVEGPGAKQLTIHMTLDRPSSLMAICESEDWAYHLTTFEILTGGKAGCTHQGADILWQFVW